MKIHRNSAWSQQEISNYLDQTNTPLRIACNDGDGYPIICSLWFVHQDGVLWAASHKNSHIIKTLLKNPKIGFEVATNEYPYHGVRGKANVELLENEAGSILEKVIAKYLQDSNQKLGTWLMSRKKDEYAIKISPLSLNSWDFSERMEQK
jgi:nitroimidazol reductase NimA-like FMN-containing flavoprotein (pyridoxamine 5'-phosphate oxidase superfamily)